PVGPPPFTTLYQLPFHRSLLLPPRGARGAPRRCLFTTLLAQDPLSKVQLREALALFRRDVRSQPPGIQAPEATAPPGKALSRNGLGAGDTKPPSRRKAPKRSRLLRETAGAVRFAGGCKAHRPW